MTYIRICLALVIITLHLPVYAYTGPGLGMGILSIAVGVLGSIFLGILAVVWYPIKRLLRALRKRRQRSPNNDAHHSD
jgi:hypothetical protein